MPRRPSGDHVPADDNAVEFSGNARAASGWPCLSRRDADRRRLTCDAIKRDEPRLRPCFACTCHLPVNLSVEYSQQYQWRPWRRIYAALPDLRGQTLLDLGCGVGDQAADLAARGARVIGIDMNDELLRTARSRNIA